MTPTIVTFYPDSLIGVIDATLADSGLFAPDWPLSLVDLRDEVIAILVDSRGWADCAETYGRAETIARHIGRARGVRGMQN